MRHLEDFVDVKAAIAPATTDGAVTGIAVNTTGYSRARFIFVIGGTAGTGALSANQLKIWKASTSGATYSSIASAVLTAAITSGVLSAGAVTCVIDVPTDPDNVWQKVSGNLTSTSLLHAAVVELYNGFSNPPSSSANQLITV